MVSTQKAETIITFNMINITITCESATKARVYLNAQEYLNLLSDFYAAVRSAKKHGSDQDVLKTVDAFMPDFMAALDHADGAY